MAENPLTKLARLVGGVAMLPGPLGYQVLGQLLISRSTGTEVAGANVVLAAVSRHSNVAVQIAVRSMVPAVVVEALSRKEQRRLERLSAEIAQLLQELEARSAEVYGDSRRIKESTKNRESPKPLDEALLREVFKLRCQSGPIERWEKALQSLFKDYKTVLFANTPNRLDTKPTDEIHEMKPDMGKAESSSRSKQVTNASRVLAVRTHKKAVIKKKATTKKKAVSKKKVATNGKEKKSHRGKRNRRRLREENS